MGFYMPVESTIAENASRFSLCSKWLGIIYNIHHLHELVIPYIYAEPHFLDLRPI